MIDKRLFSMIKTLLQLLIMRLVRRLHQWFRLFLIMNPKQTTLNKQRYNQKGCSFFNRTNNVMSLIHSRRDSYKVENKNESHSNDLFLAVPDYDKCCLWGDLRVEI